MSDKIAVDMWYKGRPKNILSVNIEFFVSFQLLKFDRKNSQKRKNHYRKPPLSLRKASQVA